MEKKYALKKIERISSSPHSQFNSLGSNIITNILFPFFTYKEIKNMKNINILFYNCFIDYVNLWFNDLKNILNEYKIEFPTVINTISKNESIDKKIKYKCPYDKCHYIEFSEKGFNHIGLFIDENWTWKNDSRYYETKIYKNSFFNNETPYLITVCWVDTNLTMTNIKDGHYKLYLRHSVYKLREKCMRLKIFLNDNEIFSSEYPTRMMIDNNLNFLKNEKKKIKEEEKEDIKEENKEDIKEEKKEDIKEEKKEEEVRKFFRGRLIGGRRIFIEKKNEIEEYEDLLYDELIEGIKISEDKENKLEKEGNKIEVKFYHNDDFWKNDWGIDSVYLVVE